MKNCYMLQKIKGYISLIKLVTSYKQNFPINFVINFLFKHVTNVTLIYWNSYLQQMVLRMLLDRNNKGRGNKLRDFENKKYTKQKLNFIILDFHHDVTQ